MEREPEWLMMRRRAGREKRKEEEFGLAAALAGSGEVHGVLGVIVDLNRLGQSLRVPAVALTRHVAALGAAGQRGREFRKQSARVHLYICSSAFVNFILLFICRRKR